MSETERADQIAAGPRRRFIANVAIALALALGLAGVLLGWHQLGERAENAETATVSLAEQVQAECDTNGELRVNGRDLCDLADEVVEDPGAELVPVNGRDGTDGRDGADGRDGIDGKDGRDGKPGKDGRPGENGTDGEPGTDGADGSDGAPGTAGRGLLSMQCAAGGWIVQYTDGLATPDRGPCRGQQGDPGTDGRDGVDGKDGTARPGTYICPGGEYIAGFTIADGGAVELDCQVPAPPVAEPPTPTPSPTP